MVCLQHSRLWSIHGRLFLFLPEQQFYPRTQFLGFAASLDLSQVCFWLFLDATVLQDVWPILNFLVWSITILQEEQNKIPSHACKVPLEYWRTLSAADILTAVWLSFSFFFKNLSMIAEKEFILHVLFNFYNSWSYLLWQKPIKTTVIKSREPGWALGTPFVFCTRAQSLSTEWAPFCFWRTSW